MQIHTCARSGSLLAGVATGRRFLNAKPTLAASREQAQRTHKWRVRMDVDNVLRKPCPGFEEISTTFPTYTLLNNSADGHAVVMMKVSFDCLN